MLSLATIRKIEAVNGDTYTVGGVEVTDTQYQHKVDELVIHCKAGSVVPHDLAPFLSKEELSEDLLLTGDMHEELGTTFLIVYRADSRPNFFKEGDDVTEWLGITPATAKA
jgi:hypothetical protein